MYNVRNPYEYGFLCLCMSDIVELKVGQRVQLMHPFHNISYNVNFIEEIFAVCRILPIVQ